MAASTIILSRSKSPDGSFWQMPDHGRAVAQSGWGASCPTRRISPMIDSCAKARVIAIMALELLAFDGKLHEGRKNWACPFGQCRENFEDAKTLMRHVPDCSHFARDKVYCNSCDEHDCFSFRNQQNHFCGLDDNAGNSDKGSPKKNKTMRKLSGLLSWSRPSSRASSRSSVQFDSPRSLSAQHGSISVMIPTHNAPTRGPKPSFSCTQEPSGQAIESVTPAHPYPEMEGSSRPWELSGEPATPELDDTRILISSLSEEYSQPQIIADADLLESPVEDLNMDQRTPDFLMFRADTCAPTYATAMTQVPFPSTTNHMSGPRPSAEHEHQTTWALIEQSPPSQQLYTAISPFTSPGGMHDGYDMTSNNNVSPIGSIPASHTFSPQASHFPPPAPSTPNKSRHGSGHSWSSSTSYSTMASEPSGSPQWHHHSQQSSFSSTAPSGSVPSSHYAQQPGFGTIHGIPHSGSTVSLLSIAPANSQINDYQCPYCSFHPTGKRENFATYLNKHIANQHVGGKIPCPDCGKELSRSDNLKTHQKNSCPKTRQLGRSYQQQWTADNMEWESADIRDFQAPPRLSQGSRFSREIRSK